MWMIGLFGCISNGFGVSEIGSVGIPLDTGAPCPDADGALTLWAATGAAVGPIRLVDHGPLPVLTDGDTRTVVLEVGSDGPGDFGRVVATLTDVFGARAAEADVPEAARTWFGHACGLRFDPVGLALPDDLEMDGLPFQLDVVVTVDGQSAPQTATYLLVGRDPPS